MNKVSKNKKNAVRKLGSDQEYVSAFLSETPQGGFGGSGRSKTAVNRHGLPFLDACETRFPPSVPPEPAPESTLSEAAADEEVDFSELLAQSLKTRPVPKKPPKPVPLKKRLQRYPSPEADLDLHGFTALGAQLKARSFVQSGLAQGYFTLRIIVGRGLHSDEGPVLPQVVEDLLQEMKIEKTILAYEWEGGKKRRSGALILYLNQFND